MNISVVLLNKNNLVLDQSVLQDIDIDKDKLYEILQKAVSVSNDQSLQSLLDLHFQLNRIVNKYSRTYIRKNLPGVCINIYTKIIC